MLGEIIAVDPHTKAAKLHRHIRAFRQLLDRRLPDRENVVPFAVIGADGERTAAMVQHDLRVREGAGQGGHVADLRVVQPGIEAQI